MKILLISQYFPPDMGALAARASELCNKWSETDHDISVLTAFPSYPAGIIPQEYQGLKYKIETYGKINVIRTRVYAGHYSGILNRIRNYFSFLYSGIFIGKGLINKPDVIIATSPPIFVAIIGYVLSRLKKSKFIFEVRDLWPESIIQVGSLNNKLIIYVLKKIELFLYRKANRIVAVTDSFKIYISDLGITNKKIDVIKNGVDLELYNPDEDHGIPKELHHLSEKYIISYIGNHGMAQGLSTIVEVARLAKKIKNLHFVLVGEGADKPKLLELSKKYGLNNITFINHIKKSEIPAFYQRSKIVLVPLRNLKLFRQVIPSKVFEIMAMKKPIVLSVDGEVRKIVVEDAKAGLFAEPENALDILNKIQQFLIDPKKGIDFGENGREFVLEFFDRNKLAENYLKIIEKIA
jgi:glycosyltransferase involved in cell wall biosynthesis